MNGSVRIFRPKLII